MNKVEVKTSQTKPNSRADTYFASTATDFLKTSSDKDHIFSEGRSKLKQFTEQTPSASLTLRRSKNIIDAIAQLKEKSRKLKELVSSLSSREQEDEFAEVTQKETREMLLYRKADSRRELKSYALAKEMALSKNCKVLQKNYAARAIKGEKVRIKSALDNKAENIDDKFKTPLDRKKIDAAFSRAFYKQRRKEMYIKSVNY